MVSGQVCGLALVVVGLVLFAAAWVAAGRASRISRRECEKERALMADFRVTLQESQDERARAEQLLAQTDKWVNDGD